MLLAKQKMIDQKIEQILKSTLIEPVLLSYLVEIGFFLGAAATKKK